jgi:DNA-binding NarL/FixJ family response regulator
MREPSQIQVLIADDHPLFRDGMTGLLDSVQETEVVGEAADGEEAVRLARELRPAGDALLFRREALPPANLPGVDGTGA